MSVGASSKARARGEAGGERRSARTLEEGEVAGFGRQEELHLQSGGGCTYGRTSRVAVRVSPRAGAWVVLGLGFGESLPKMSRSGAMAKDRCENWGFGFRILKQKGGLYRREGGIGRRGGRGGRGVDWGGG
jgi:hypothetical protein